MFIQFQNFKIKIKGSGFKVKFNLELSSCYFHHLVIILVLSEL